MGGELDGMNKLVETFDGMCLSHKSHNQLSHKQNNKNRQDDYSKFFTTL